MNKALQETGTAWLVGVVDELLWMSCDNSGPIYVDTCDAALKFADQASAETFMDACIKSPFAGNRKFRVEDHQWGYQPFRTRTLSFW